jgi:DNA-directed RNA polymerase subunit RPC12/RpoP
VQPATPQASKATPGGRKFPCKKCGARLDFDPSLRALHCPYCGFVEKIEPASHEVTATNWDDYWANHAGETQVIAGRASEVTCSTCGAVVLLEDKVATDRCPYCATFLENQPEAAKALIPPVALLPFSVSERDAQEAFNQWVAGRWFAPSTFREFANLGKLSGAYVPFWTFDSMTYTHYTGERGDDYTVTETYTENDANGQPVTKTRQVTHTRWTRVSGEVQRHFEDVLVYASQSLPQQHVYRLSPWELRRIEEFRSEFLSGFQTERYTVGLREGFDQARAIMDEEIRGLCTQDIGGNHQRLLTVNTQHVGVTFKHILLPVWLAAYRYREQPYRVLINGRTGKVVGTRPYSWVKITLLVLVIVLAVIAAILFFASRAHGATAGRRAQTPLRSVTKHSPYRCADAGSRAGCSSTVVLRPAWSEAMPSATRRTSSLPTWMPRSMAAAYLSPGASFGTRPNCRSMRRLYG